MHPEAKVTKRFHFLIQQGYAGFTLGFPMLADSTVLAYVMKTLNERYQYGLELFLLSIDEGITGYRDDSLEVGRSYLFGYKHQCSYPYSNFVTIQTVKRNQQQYDMPLKILSYDELYGWTMDSIVSQVGRKNNCTFCGVFRRQALDRGAAMLNVDHIVTGHNADDIAETVLMNSAFEKTFFISCYQLTLQTVFFDSHAWRYCETWTMYFNLHSRRRYNSSIKAF